MPTYNSTLQAVGGISSGSINQAVTIFPELTVGNDPLDSFDITEFEEYLIHNQVICRDCGALVPRICKWMDLHIEHHKKQVYVMDEPW